MLLALRVLFIALRVLLVEPALVHHLWVAHAATLSEAVVLHLVLSIGVLTALDVVVLLVLNHFVGVALEVRVFAVVVIFRLQKLVRSTLTI